MTSVSGRILGPARTAVNSPADHFTTALEGAAMRDESTRTTESTQVEVEYRDLTPLGYPGYRVGNDGSVWSCRRFVSLGIGKGSRSVLSSVWRPLKLALNTNGYPHILLHGSNKRYTRMVHRLVLEAFVGPPPQQGAECCHNDGNPKNNHLTNLRWGDSSRQHRRHRPTRNPEGRKESEGEADERGGDSNTEVVCRGLDAIAIGVSFLCAVQGDRRHRSWLQVETSSLRIGKRS